jgi:hypothetical protein
MSSVSPDTLLYHATASHNLDSISREGLFERTYFTSDEDVMKYYCETIVDEGNVPVALVVRLGDLDVDGIFPDIQGIEEPLTYTLGCTEEEVEEDWKSSEQRWEDSLDIIKTICYKKVIPADVVKYIDASGNHCVFKNASASFAKKLGF